MFYFLFAENALPPPLPFLLLLLLPPRLWFGFLKSCPQDIRHHFTVYNFRGRAALQPSPRTLLIIHINSVETKKERVEWDGAVMKEDEMARLEAENIGRERKIKVQRKEKREIRRGMRGALEKGDWIEVGGEEKREKMDKESTRGVYLSALCHSSSGHLLRYIKGFALISMPLHPSHGACLCVHPYGLKRLRVCIHMLERVRCISARASASLLPFTDFFELRRALARVRGPPPVPVRTYGTCLVRNYTGALRFPVECLWEGGWQSGVE